jgi:hypothetical protein
LRRVTDSPGNFVLESAGAAPAPRRRNADGWNR